MRFMMLIPLLALGLGCGGAKHTEMSPGRLDGTWIPVKQEIGGKALPPAAFKSQKLIISDTTYTFSAESVDRGTLVYAGNKMDIYGKEGVNAGKHFTAIYRNENGELTICYNLAGDAYPPAFDTKGSASLFLSVFKQESMR